MKKIHVIIWLTVAFLSAYGQYRMEKLDRGVVAVRVGNNNFVSWRWLGTEDNITFNLYRNGTKVNNTPLSVTNYTDNGAPANASYTVRPVVNNVEGTASEGVSPWSQQYLQIPLQIPPSGTTPIGENYSYNANDCSIADLDGDGKWEIVVKWEPNNSKDAAQPGFTGPTYIDAYKLNGTRLWRINMGRNIRSGAHYTQFMVYDFDGDGKAEMMVKTADGTVDGTGKVIGSATANHVQQTTVGDRRQGFILEGPEYLSVFEGATGKVLATTNYIPARGNVSSWGDPRGNRVDRFRAGVAYLDGQQPSAIFGRGYYTRLVMAAWDWRNGKLTNRWTFDSNSPGNGGYAGQGDHSLSVADVDDDGKQEIISGSAIIDDDGKPYFNTGFGHGDALHVSDLDPDVPGLEVFNIQEWGAQSQDCYMYSGKSKRVLWTRGAPNEDEGPGRGVSADITAKFRGAECWVAGGSAPGAPFTCKGTSLGLAQPQSVNFLAWWDGDLLRELLSGTQIDKYEGGRLLTASGCASNNGSKSTPALSGDFFGDWREEVMWRTSDNRYLRIYTTTIPSAHKIRTLMHDPQYRTAIAWQNGGYNQPPHVSFFLGDGMTAPPKPNITIVGSSPSDCAGIVGGTATLDACGRCIGGSTGREACSLLTEAEDACDFDGVEETTHSGYKGVSYVNVPNEIGASVTFTMAAEKAGFTTLSFRFANGGAEGRPGQLSVNGTNLASPITFPSTGTWSDWQIAEVRVSHVAGINKFVISSTTAGGLPNIDQIGFTGTGLSRTSCGVVTHEGGYDASMEIALYPNPSNNGFHLYLPELSKVKVMNVQGIIQEELNGIGTLYFGENYTSGMYLIEISSENKSIIKRASKK